MMGGQSIKTLADPVCVLLLTLVHFWPLQVHHMHAQGCAPLQSSCLQVCSMPKLAGAAKCHACALSKPNVASIPTLHAEIAADHPAQ